MCLTLRGNRLHAAQVDGLALRRVAQASIGAALPTDLDLAAGVCRNQYLNLVAIDLGSAKELIAMFKPLGQYGGVCCVQPVKLEAFLIQIVGVGYFPLQAGFAGGQWFGTECEGLVDRQKVGLCKRIAGRLGDTDQTHQEQGQQQTHG